MESTENEIEDEIKARARILACLKATHPRAISKNKVMKDTGVYWYKVIDVVKVLVKEGLVEEIETAGTPLYRIVKK